MVAEKSRVLIELIVFRIFGGKLIVGTSCSLCFLAWMGIVEKSWSRLIQARFHFTQRSQGLSSLNCVKAVDTKTRYYPQSRKGYGGGQTKSADQRVTQRFHGFILFSALLLRF